MSTQTPALPATLFLFAYNQADTIMEAAMSCLGQVCDPIEIVFSDDASTDHTFAKLVQIADQYTGPHTVSVRRNAKNLGIAGHYNQAVACAQSDLIVVAAGDDLSEPHRVASVLDAWRASQGRLNLIASYATSIDSHGKALGLIQTGHLEQWPDAQTWCKKRPYVIGATFAFDKKLFTVFGPLAKGVDYEDQVLSLRAAALGGGLTLPEPLVQYRQGGLSSRQRVGHKDLLTQAQNKYQRQLAVYTQITKDMATIGQSHLSQGKIAGYIKKSKTALALMQQAPQRSTADLVGFALRNPDSPGVGWSMLKLLWAKYPRIAYALKQKI